MIKTIFLSRQFNSINAFPHQRLEQLMKWQTFSLISLLLILRPHLRCNLSPSVSFSFLHLRPPRVNNIFLILFFVNVISGLASPATRVLLDRRTSTGWTRTWQVWMNAETLDWSSTCSAVMNRRT